MTVRLDAAARRKVERSAAKQGISLNEALNRLLREAPDPRERPTPHRRSRLPSRKVGFGFEIADARRLAAETSDGWLAQRRG